MGTLPEFIYRFNGNFIRISIYLILWVKKLILKFLNNCKGFDITTNNNRNLEKEQSRKIRISQFHNLLEKIVIKTKWYWHKDGNSDQCNKTKNPEIKPCLCPTFNKKVRSIQWKRNSLFNKWCYENWYHIKIKKWDASLTWYTIINSKLMENQWETKKLAKRWKCY